MEGGYRAGEMVEVFYRFAQHPADDLWMPVPSVLSGTCIPRIGQSDGWQPAEVVEDWMPPTGKGDPGMSFVRVRYTHRFWFNRKGERIRPSDENPDMLVQRVQSRQVRRPPANRAPPDVSFLVVRSVEECDPVFGGNGGWGNAGSCISDPFIRLIFEGTVYPMLGNSYQVITVMVRNSADLKKIHAPTLAQQMHGRHKVGMYFLFPVAMQELSDLGGYVMQDALLTLMSDMEAEGVVSRFPHHSHLYRTILTKDWMAHLCLMPELQCPITTKVSRGLIARNPRAAARSALQSLHNLQLTSWRRAEIARAGRKALGPGRGDTVEQSAASGAPAKPQRVAEEKGQEGSGETAVAPVPALRGVAKLGYSWEACDVICFRGEYQLMCALEKLCEQPGGLADAVLVQEWITFDCELRLFFVEPQVIVTENGLVQPVQPAKILYTRFNQIDDEGKMRDFERMTRDHALQNSFRGDERALQDAESQACLIAANALLWLQTECSETPPSLRMDFLIRRTDEGTASVHLGELTELGACFLGWEHGPSIVFGAMTRSCFSPPCGRDHQPCGYCRGERPPPYPSDFVPPPPPGPPPPEEDDGGDEGEDDGGDGNDNDEGYNQDDNRNYEKEGGGNGGGQKKRGSAPPQNSAQVKQRKRDS